MNCVIASVVLILFLLASNGVQTISLRKDSRSSAIWDPSTKTLRHRDAASKVVNSTIVDWGLTIPDGTEGVPCAEGDECLDYGVAKVVVTYMESCDRILWTTSNLTELKDCLYANGHWYGGGSQYNEPWPLEKLPRAEVPHVTSDFLSVRDRYGGILEHYWVSSQGIAAHVENTVPLFFSMPDNDGDGRVDLLCFSSRFEQPFVRPAPDAQLTLDYQLCYGDDIRQVYETSFPHSFTTPSGLPDARMISSPVWSTWAEYKTDINEEKVLSMAQSILDNGFNNSQLEIDDNWETCYGNHDFDTGKFPDPAGMVATLHSMGFRVTLWIHPFINDNCESFTVADTNGYFLKDESGNTLLTSWWQGSSAGLIDFTNADAVSWWSQKLEDLRTNVGIDSYKFDAGETSWMPDQSTLSIDKTLWPNGFTTAYVHAVAKFGTMIETRVGHNVQNEPIFIRMLDKDSNWSDNNGLKTLIPSLLLQGLLGYPYVLPDMVGGNAYGGRPSDELFIRWAQANTFMPSIQFSMFPWEFIQTANDISLQVSALHNAYTSVILGLAQNAVDGMGPMMRPTWWLCPQDEDCLLADQQFLLGDDILVTPVVDEGVTEKDVVFPPGTWKKEDDGVEYVGPSKQTISGITIQSNIFFTRV